MAKPKRLITMYVGHPDNTWDLVVVEVPGNLREDEIEYIAKLKLMNTLDKEGVQVSFCGVYFEESTEESKTLRSCL